MTDLSTLPARHDDAIPAQAEPRPEHVRDAQPPVVDPASYRAGYRAGHADAFTGAADDPGDLNAVATDAQWLRRLLDLPAVQRLAAASYYAATAATSRRCREENHAARLTAAEAQLDAARTAVEDAARVTSDHHAAVREARIVAAQRAWDCAADYLIGAQGPDVAAILRDANPYTVHPAAPEGDDQ